MGNKKRYRSEKYYSQKSGVLRIQAHDVFELMIQTSAACSDYDQKQMILDVFRLTARKKATEYDMQRF